MSRISHKTDNNPIKQKSFHFAVRIIKFAKWLRLEHKEFELASQILRSGTSIGANVSEAQYAQSRKDFLSKLNIALKEAYETEYWLQLFLEADIITRDSYNSLQRDLTEILKLLIKITKTTKTAN